MQEIGVDVSKMAKRDTIRRLAKKSGISEEKIKEIGLNPEDKIGISKRNIAKRYRKDRSYVSEEQLKILEELGISLELRNVPQEFIETLEKMQETGVDVSKLVRGDTIGSLAKKSGISEEKILEIGLNPEDKIGISKNYIAISYRKDRSYVSEEQLKILEELGISLEKNLRTGKEIAEASISSLTDIEMSDREDAALKELVEKTKEGGIERDE